MTSHHIELVGWVGTCTELPAHSLVFTRTGQNTKEKRRKTRRFLRITRADLLALVAVHEGKRACHRCAAAVGGVKLQARQGALDTTRYA